MPLTSHELEALAVQLEALTPESLRVLSDANAKEGEGAGAICALALPEGVSMEDLGQYLQNRIDPSREFLVADHDRWLVANWVAVDTVSCANRMHNLLAGWTGTRPIMSFATATAGQTWMQIRDEALHKLSSEVAAAKPARAKRPQRDWMADKERIRMEVDVLGVAARRLFLKRAGPHLFKTLCPFHKETDPSFFIYPGPAALGGHAYCYGACKRSFDAIALIQALDHLDFKQAVDQCLKEVGMELVSEMKQVRWVDNTWGEWHIPKIYGEVYRDLWDQLTMTPEHREALRRRGLTDDAINRCEFRSMPPYDERGGWWRKLGRDQDTMTGIPGFSWVNDGSLVGGPGMLIPVRAIDGTIIGAQIRADRAKDGDNKYRWLSTPETNPRYPGGASSGSPPHMAWPGGVPQTGHPSHLFLTEGPLKATIIAEIIHVPVIGVAGIGRYNAAHPLIDAMEPQYVVLAYDADVWTADPKDSRSRLTQDALHALMHHPALTPDRVLVARWDPADGKGLDDVVAAHHKFRVVPAADMVAPDTVVSGDVDTTTSA